MRFTDRSVKALKPADRRYEVFEDGRKGLGVRISPHGSRSWIFVYRRNGKLARITLGQYPQMSLAEAHAEHGKRRDMLRKGTDPAKVARLAKEEAIKAPTVAQLSDLYIERHAKARKRSWGEDERILQKDVLPRWGHHKARDISRRDVVALLDDIVDRGSPIAANRTLACVRKLFNFGLERSLLETSPCLAVKAPGRETQRDRVLSDNEIHTLWHGLDTLRPHPLILLALKLQLVTAQRKAEIVNAEWHEIALDSGWWTIPAQKSKNTLPHRVPLSSLARALLESIAELGGGSQFLFPGRRGDKPLLETSVDHALRLNRETLGIANVTPHDLRRTAASHMTSIGISRLVVSKVLNHAESGVTAVYDRHSYDAEKRQALDAWARRLQATIEGNASNDIAEIHRV